MTRVRVVAFGTEGGYLIVFTLVDYGDGTVLDSRVYRPSEHRLDFPGSCRCRQVVVTVLLLQEIIPDGASDKVERL